MQQWYVYILNCADDTYYTGITTDIDRRLHEHNHLKCAAAYTRARRPVRLVYQEICEDRAQAARREYTIRKLGREAKALLIATSERSGRDEIIRT